MSVGPTVLSVTSGIGTPAVLASSKKMYCSSGERSWPPYSFGHPTPSHPSRPIWRTTSRYAVPPDSPPLSTSRRSGVSSRAK